MWKMGLALDPWRLWGIDGAVGREGPILVFSSADPCCHARVSRIKLQSRNRLHHADTRQTTRLQGFRAQGESSALRVIAGPAMAFSCLIHLLFIITLDFSRTLTFRISCKISSRHEKRHVGARVQDHGRKCISNQVQALTGRGGASLRAVIPEQGIIEQGQSYKM